ncbi:MAG TPA: VWA domain-containing protein [Chlamydiales bacterium]
MNNFLEKRLLPLSVFSSFLVHLCCALFLQTYSLWFSSERPKTLASPTQLSQTPRHEILHLSVRPIQSAAPTPIRPTIETSSSTLAQTPSSLPQNVPSQTPELHFPSPEIPFSTVTPKRTHSFPFPAVNPTLLLPKNLTLSALSQPTPTPKFLPHSEATSLPAMTSSSLPSFALPSSPFTETQLPPLSIEATTAKATPSSYTPQLPIIPTLAELDTVNLSEAFEAELLFFSREDGLGHLFALTLIPRKDLDLPKLHQHVTFLIDRSNSIQSERLTASKNAVRKALEELGEDTSFNVFVFDNKVEKLFPSLKSSTKEAILEADNFLGRIQLGSFFSTADVFKPLLHTIPGKVAENEVYTTVLLTDGESLGKKQVQKQLLHDWTYRNQGKSALYTLAMGTDAHLGSLDAISALNKGKLLYASTKRGLKRKLLKLMKTIQAPIAKGISVKAIIPGGEAKIDVYSSPESSSTLYLNQPYVILGTTTSLDDFVLFFQGRMKDRWLHIKKTVSFINAKRGGNSLKAEWALQQAYRHYEQYAVDNDPQHIADARLLLEPYNIQTAFE